MRICFVNTSSSWGGGEKWHFEMAEQMMQKTHNVILIAFAQSQLFQKASDAEIPVKTLKTGNLSFLNPVKRFAYKKLIKDIKPDVVIINAPSELKLCSAINRKLGIKTIYRRGSAIPVRNTFLNRRIFGKFIDLILANSKQTKNTILKNNPALFPKENIHVIYNGIDMAKYDKQTTTDEFKKFSGKLIIGNAGRLVRQKAQHYLIDIASNLKKENIDFLIRIAGDGPLKNELIGKVEKEGLQKHFEFCGFVKDMKSFMQSLDIFVLTSLWEGFGYVLLEAMINAKPIVAFKISSNPELVKENENGYLVEMGNMKEFHKMLRKLFDPETRERMGNMGRKFAEDQFDLKIASAKLDQLLKEQIL